MTQDYWTRFYYLWYCTYIKKTIVSGVRRATANKDF